MNRNRVTIILLAAFTLSLLYAPIAAATEHCTVTLYEHAHYEGEERTFTEDVRRLRDVDFPDANFGWQDKASSIKLSGGARVVLYEHSGYSGTSIIFTREDIDRLRPHGWNDLAASLRVFCPPTVTHVGPAIGADNKVHVAVGESVTFEVQVDGPLFPGSSIIRYEWATVVPSNSPDFNITSPDSMTSLSIESPGDWEIHARMVMEDDDDLGEAVTEPVIILVRVWDIPVVDPPLGTDSSYYAATDTSYFVGVKDQPVKLMASPGAQNRDPTEEIQLVSWFDNRGNAPTILGHQVVGSKAPDGTDLSVMDSERGSVLEFDGVDDYVQVPAFEIGGDMTVTAWVYAENPHADWSRIIDFGDGPGQNNVLLAFSRTTGRMAWQVKLFTQRVTTAEEFPSSQWVHVAVVQQENTATIYWDGVQKASGSVQSPKTRSRTRQYIGKSNSPGDAYFDGKMDDVVIFHRALSQTEIQTLMDNPFVHTWDIDFAYDSQALQVEAVTNFGIRSDRVDFGAKIYAPSVFNASADGSGYSGAAGAAVQLEGEIENVDQYTGDFEYKWYRLPGESETTISEQEQIVTPTESEGRATYTWTKEGVFPVKFEATVTTVEDLIFTASAETSVDIEAGVPTAEISPRTYRGGIGGGNFSPIQFFGIGHQPPFSSETIEDWSWSFSEPGNHLSRALRFDGVDDYVQVPAFEIGEDMTVTAWVYAENPTANWSTIIDFGDGPGQNNGNYSGIRRIR